MRRLAPLIVLTALWLAPPPSEAGKPTGEASRLVPGEGIFLLVSSTGDAISIERVGRTRSPAILPRPSLPPDGWERHPPGTEDLIVSVHDRRGRLLAAYGYPTRRVAFYDTVEPKSGELSGGPRGLASVMLAVHVPYTRGAALLVFWRDLVRWRGGAGAGRAAPKGWSIDGTGPYGPVSYVVVPLGAFPLGDRPPDVAKLDIPRRLWPAEIARKFIASPEDLKNFIKHTRLRTKFGWQINDWPLVCGHGPLANQNIGAGTPNDTSFNVAILGDGYTSAEMTKFSSDANAVRDELLARRPFSEFKAQINVYRIDTPSQDSGVDHCPGTGAYTCPSTCYCPGLPADPKTTALDVSGDASGIGACTEFKGDETKITDAACSALDPAAVDLFVVIVNCPVYGAMTYPAVKTVFVASGHAPDVIAHESAHALAPIGEEYQGGVLPCLSADCSSGCPAPVEFVNVALPADVLSRTVSWYPLASQSERGTAPGTFATVENQGCYTTSCTYLTSHNGTCVSGESQTLGLYWGAQYLKEGDDPAVYCSTCQTCRVNVNGQCVTLCYDWCDVRGAGFYRPMPYCTMRFLDEPYCRVCYCALREVLATRTGVTPASSWCGAPPPAPASVRRTDSG